MKKIISAYLLALVLSFTISTIQAASTTNSNTFNQQRVPPKDEVNESHVIYSISISTQLFAALPNIK